MCRPPAAGYFWVLMQMCRIAFDFWQVENRFTPQNIIKNYIDMPDTKKIIWEAENRKENDILARRFTILNLFQCENSLLYSTHKAESKAILFRTDIRRVFVRRALCFFISPFVFPLFITTTTASTIATTATISSSSSSGICQTILFLLIFFFPSLISQGIFFFLFHQKRQRIHLTEQATTNKLAPCLSPFCYYSRRRLSGLPKNKRSRMRKRDVDLFQSAWIEQNENENRWNGNYREKNMRQHTHKIAVEANWKIKLQRHLWRCDDKSSFFEFSTN